VKQENRKTIWKLPENQKVAREMTRSVQGWFVKRPYGNNLPNHDSETISGREPPPHEYLTATIFTSVP
jgi:hypothetical protein